MVKKQNKHGEELVCIQPIADMVQLVMQSAFVKPYKPCSLLLIGRPEQAKTSVIAPHSHYKWVYYTNDITSKLVVDEVLQKARNKEIRMLLIPDLLNCTEKQKATRDSFLQVVKTAIEEGVTNFSTFYKRLETKKEEQPVRFGLITAITMDNFRQTQRYMNSTGLTSRFIPFSYSYSNETLAVIQDLICGLSVDSKYNVKFGKIIEKEIDIEEDIDLLKKLLQISSVFGSKTGCYGIRFQKQLTRLVKANAIMNGRKKITNEDINKILSLTKWINVDFAPI